MCYPSSLLEVLHLSPQEKPRQSTEGHIVKIIEVVCSTLRRTLPAIPTPGPADPGFSLYSCFFSIVVFPKLRVKSAHVLVYLLNAWTFLLMNYYRFNATLVHCPTGASGV